MRIVYVLTSLGVGGAERQVLGLAQRMAARGHAVKLFVLLPHGEADLTADPGGGPVGILHLGMSRRPGGLPSGVVRGFALAVREVRRFRPDLIHGNNFHGNILARLLGAALRGVPVVSTIHNVYEGGWPRMLAYRLTDALSRRTIAVSEAARERYVRIHAVSARKFGVIPNGIETAAFVPDLERRAEVRGSLGAGEDFVWIAAGRLVEAKDYPNLIYAFSQLRIASGRTQLWIAGGGDAEYAASLRELSEALELGNVVKWLGVRSDLPALLDAADAFVLSSAWEGMPLAVGEAMAMEKPVVATDVGGVRELLGEGQQLVPAGKAGALAQAMFQLTKLGAEEREAMGREGRERILSRFNMDSRAEEWERVYEFLVN